MIAEIVNGAEVEDAVNTVIKLLDNVADGEVLKKTLCYALDLVRNEEVDPKEAITKMGYGFEAYEALAIAVYCAVLHYDSPRHAIQLAANHSGASDTCASMTAALLGAYFGIQGFPKKWVEKLQYKNLISAIADKMLKVVYSSDEDSEEEEEE
jgi:ADP-ribosylglycohydrolase